MFTSCLIQCRHADADCCGCCVLTCAQQQQVIEALQAGGPEQAPPQQVKALIRTMTLEKLFGGDQVGDQVDAALHCLRPGSDGCRCSGGMDG